MSAEDDDMSRQKTVLANADQVVRDQTERREIRMREDRVRRLDEDETSQRRPRPSSPVVAGPSVISTPSSSSASRLTPGTAPPGPSQAPPTAPSPPASSSQPRQKAPPQAAEGAPSRSSRSRPAPGALAPEESDSAGSSPRISDPFPPLVKKRPISGRSGPAPQDSGAEPPAHRNDKSGPAPARRPSGPYQPLGPPPSATDQMAVELEELMRRFRLGYRALRSGDKIASICAVMVLAGTLMPWVSMPGRSLEVGVLMGGIVHVLVSVSALVFIARGDGKELAYSHAELVRQRQRVSLYIVLLGALSTFYGAYLLLLWGAQKSLSHPVEVHFGLYWTLAWGTGLSYGGFARFSDGDTR